MRCFSDLLPFPVTAGDKRLWVALVTVQTPFSSRKKKKRWTQKKEKSLASGVLAVFSGIHYLARLKIHQRLPPFQHMVNLNFTASSSRQLSLIWGAASSTVHQGEAYVHRHGHIKCHRWTNKHGYSKSKQEEKKQGEKMRGRSLRFWKYVIGKIEIFKWR